MRPEKFFWIITFRIYNSFYIRPVHQIIYIFVHNTPPFQINLKYIIIICILILNNQSYFRSYTTIVISLLIYILFRYILTHPCTKKLCPYRYLRLIMCAIFSICLLSTKSQSMISMWKKVQFKAYTSFLHC